MVLNPSTSTDLALQTLRRMGGVATSAGLQQGLGLSQPTVSRLLGQLIKEGRLLKRGRGRNQRYVCPRKLADLPSVIPIFEVDAFGALHPFATLITLVGGATWVEDAKGQGKVHGGLPWFLADMRPQGFMGRCFAGAYPSLAMRPNPEQWTDDEVLVALYQAGHELMGNLLVGVLSMVAYEQAKALINSPSNHQQIEDYPQLAKQALLGAYLGSSAGGEQPKFVATVSGKQVIVKFSLAGPSALAQRTRDLLVCEHLALQTLTGAGLPAAHSQLFEREGRMFLQLDRFDRTPQGRIGMVSLLAFDAEYLGQMDNWASTAQRMADRAMLPATDARVLQLWEAFGQLIGNTDRHYGNVSLLRQQKHWRLAPAYDMLPMVFAPVANELVPRSFDPGTLQPTASTFAVWADALQLARSFWSAVRADARISTAFVQMCPALRSTTESLYARFRMNKSGAPPACPNVSI